MVLFKIAGPALPCCSSSFTHVRLVTSPTNKGVILIGGSTEGDKRIPFLYELSGDSEHNLTWTKLDQKLDKVRSHHVSFSIPNDCMPLK